MSRDRNDASHDPGGLGEPATERYVGRRDLTYWSRPARAFVGLVLRISSNAPAFETLAAVCGKLGGAKCQLGGGSNS